jgi:hypothetical protein
VWHYGEELMAQQALFDGDAEPAAVVRRRATRRATAAVKPRVEVERNPIEDAAAQFVAANDPLERARLAAQLRDLAADAVASNIRDASNRGKTWREIGAALEIPFQTLHRRYGEKY